MKPIGQNDYYGIFQTGLLVASEALGLKQAHLADVCGVSKSYLSKLKGWEWDKASNTLQARPHVTNTNFKRYAVPLMQFLEQKHQISFTDGYFMAAADDAAARQWGDLKTIEPAQSIRAGHPDEELYGLLDEFEVPEAGELTIEWNLDLSNPANLSDLVEKISRLAEKANAQLSVAIKLRKKQKQQVQGRNPPARTQTGRDYRGADLYGMRNDGLGRISVNPEAEYDATLNQLSSQLQDNPYVNLSIETGEPGAFEHISGRDALSGCKREQFCDFSAWEALHREGDWEFITRAHAIQGRGLHQYLLSRYDYGTLPFSLHAVLRFQGYALHAGAAAESANAGIVLGWKEVDGRSQYYHLLLDGQSMCLEQVGARTGDHIGDYQHLDAGVPFVVDEDTDYSFLLQITHEWISVYVDQVLHYQVATPPGLEGRAGIRPWRAKVTCSYFEVREG